MTGTAASLGAGDVLRLGRAGRQAAAMLAVLVAGGAFSLALSGLNPRAAPGPESASLRSQFVLGLAFAALLIGGVLHPRRMLRTVKANLVFLLPPLLAFASVAWAPEPAVAARRAAAFAATVLCGLAIAADRPGRDGLNFITRTAAIGVLLSLVYVIVDPALALHQTTDGVQSVHAGDWRGVFVHRTALGQLSALTLAFAVYGGRAFYGRTGRMIVGGATLLCLFQARSGGGEAEAVLLLFAPLAVRLWRRLPLLGRAAAVAAAGLALALAAAPLTEAALRLFGKDATLTGRTPLWSLLLQAAQARPWFGYGYSTGFRDDVAAMVAGRSAYGYVPNAQNGYLDTALNVGLVGLALVLAGLATGFGRALRLAWRDPRGVAMAPLLVMLFIATMNAVEAALVSANDLFVLLYVASAAVSGQMLRPETADTDA